MDRVLRRAPRCTVHTMSAECRDHILNYLRSSKDLWEIKETIEATTKSIQTLPYFQNGCFTYIQAAAFANYFHTEENEFIN